MKMRRLLVAATALLTMPMLVGCGPKEVDNGYTVKVWATFNDTYGATIEKAIKKMKELHPEYTIKYTKQTGMGYDGLKDLAIKGFASGDYPDAIVAYPDSVADFIMAGKALDITPYMNDKDIGWDDADKNDVIEAYLEEGSNYFVEGTHSVPLCKSTEAMYYNRSILINLDLSNFDDTINDGNPLDDDYLQSLTWEELFDHLCPALVAYNDAQPEDKKILVPAADYKDNWAIVGYDSDDNLFITLAEQYGLPYTSINQQTLKGSVDFAEKNADGSFKGVSEGYMDLMQTFAKAYQKKYFSTKGVIGKNVNYVSTTGGMLFSIGSTGGVFYQYSASTHYDVGVAPIPQAENKDIKLINQGPSLAFLKRGADKETQDLRARGAWMFYDIWSSTAINSEWCQTAGYSPIRTSVANDPSYMAYKSTEGKKAETIEILYARNAQYVAETLDYLFSSPVYYGSSKARSAVAGVMADIFKASKNKDGSLVDVDSAAFEAKIVEYFRNAYNASI